VETNAKDVRWWPGSLIVVGPHLIFIADDSGCWIAECLPMPATVGKDKNRLPRVVPEKLSNGWDLLVCIE
jgi:hypothetical protein